MLDILSILSQQLGSANTAMWRVLNLQSNLSTLAEIASLTAGLARPAPVSTRLAVN
jgi:hypothetical protein